MMLCNIYQYIWCKVMALNISLMVVLKCLHTNNEFFPLWVLYKADLVLYLYFISLLINKRWPSICTCIPHWQEIRIMSSRFYSYACVFNKYHLSSCFSRIFLLLIKDSTSTHTQIWNEKMLACNQSLLSITAYESHNTE